MMKCKNVVMRTVLVLGALFWSLFIYQTEAKAVNKTADDGIAWCRAKVGTSVGWLRRVPVR